MAKKKRRQPYQFRIINETWQYAVIVRIGGTEEQTMKAFERHFPSDNPDKLKASRKATRLAGRTIYRDGESCHMLWFPSIPNGGIVAHEAIHSALHVFRVKGMNALPPDSEEALCYLVQWTVNEIGRRVW